MDLKITKEIELSADEIKNIIIKYLHRYYNLSGVFNIIFSPAEIDKVTIQISENETISSRPSPVD